MSQTLLDQRVLGVGTALDDHTITASDVISFADVGASNAIKKDTVQGVLDLAGGGAWTYINTTTVNVVSHDSADILGIDSTYDVYCIVMSDGLPAANTVLKARISVDGGSSWRDTSGDYQYATIAGNSAGTGVVTGNSASATELLIQNNSSCQWATAGRGSLIFYLYDPSRTSTPRVMDWTHISVDDTPHTGRHTGAGSFKGATTAINGVSFYNTSGNIAGTFRLYGLSNS